MPKLGTNNMEFEEISIVKYLKSKNGSYYKSIVELYKICAYLLNEIPIVFPNYTLHNIEHSVRVIKNMSYFLEGRDLGQYSDLHLAVIVYAGLMHDIGMFVSPIERDTLYEEFRLNVNNFSQMTEQDKQEYLREYVRKRHGERVKYYLDENYNKSASIRNLLTILNSNQDVSDITVSICQSHDENCEWILNNLSYEEYIAYEKFYPQHAAILLRLGDALDIDERRAPWILYKLLGPRERSKDEWLKHYPISNYDKVELTKEGKYKIFFSGKTDNIKTHRYIKEYFDWLNKDINEINCILKNFRGNYKFELEYPLTEKIITEGFTFSDIKFSLNYKQITNLLMGENIYGNKQIGLRELLQNSIDAILLMKKITEKEKYEFDYTPKIKIHVDIPNNNFIIADNGTGMSKDILEKYFFAVGNSFYTSDEFNNSKYNFKPIGHFGIGFLSCFMLSSTISVETKYYKSAQAYKVDFEKSSQYICLAEKNLDFFKGDHGTRVILKYSEVQEVFGDEKAVIDFIQNYILVDGFMISIDVNHQNEYFIKSNISNRLNSINFNDNDIAAVLNFGDPIVLVDDLRQIAEYEVYHAADDLFFDNFYIAADEFKISSLPYLYECAEELNDDFRSYELNGNLDDIVNNDIDELYDDKFTPNIASEMFESNSHEILDYYKKHGDVKGYFKDLLFNKYFINGGYSWFDIPVIRDEKAFQSFQEYADQYSYEDALVTFKNSIEYFSVFGDDGKNDSSYMYVAVENFGTEVPMDYFDSYPLTPIKRYQEVFRTNLSSFCLLISRNFSLKDNGIDFKVYCKGIWLHNINLILPYFILGTNLNYIYINITSNEYEINVARNDLTDASRKKLERRITKLIYSVYISSCKPSIDTKTLIDEFIRLYCQE